MSFTGFDMQFGVRKSDTRRCLKLECEGKPDIPKFPLFNGVPVVTSDLCVEQGTARKSWKRKGRPKKVRIRHYTKKMYFFGGPPLFPRRTLICHPDFLGKLFEIAGKAMA